MNTPPALRSRMSVISRILYFPCPWECWPQRPWLWDVLTFSAEKVLLSLVACLGSAVVAKSWLMQCHCLPQSPALCAPGWQPSQEVICSPRESQHLLKNCLFSCLEPAELRFSGRRNWDRNTGQLHCGCSPRSAVCDPGQAPLSLVRS